MPWTTPETFTAGQTLTAASMNIVSGNDLHLYTNTARGLVAYAQRTTAQGSVTTATDLTDLSVTFTATAGRYYLIHGFVTVVSSAANDNCGLIITNASNTWLAGGHVISNTNAVAVHLNIFHRVNPGAGSVTYKLRGQRGSGSGTLTFHADGTTPSFIMVTDIGPA